MVCMYQDTLYSASWVIVIVILVDAIWMLWNDNADISSSNLIWGLSSPENHQHVRTEVVSNKMWKERPGRESEWCWDELYIDMNWFILRMLGWCKQNGSWTRKTRSSYLTLCMKLIMWLWPTYSVSSVEWYLRYACGKMGLRVWYDTWQLSNLQLEV